VAEQAVSCRRCKHYRISWDPNAPHGCDAMGFKSQKLPCVVVFETSGIECQLFEAKARPSP
jgi:hypothetical protein